MELIANKFHVLLETILTWYCAMFFRLICLWSFDPFKNLPPCWAFNLFFSSVQGTGALTYLLFLSWPLGIFTLMICFILASVLLLYGRWMFCWVSSNFPLESQHCLLSFICLCLVFPFSLSSRISFLLFGCVVCIGTRKRLQSWSKKSLLLLMK